MIEMIFDSVRENQETHREVALLKERTQERYVCIQVADVNAYALASALHGIPEPRPLKMCRYARGSGQKSKISTPYFSARSACSFSEGGEIE